MALISPSGPNADWACPKFVFTEAKRGWAGDAVDVGEALVFDRVTDRRPGPCASTMPTDAASTPAAASAA